MYIFLKNLDLILSVCIYWFYLFFFLWYEMNCVFFNKYWEKILYIISVCDVFYKIFSNCLINLVVYKCYNLVK